jgi:hypothetical protein
MYLLFFEFVSTLDVRGNPLNDSVLEACLNMPSIRSFSFDPSQYLAVEARKRTGEGRGSRGGSRRE